MCTLFFFLGKSVWGRAGSALVRQVGSFVHKSEKGS